MPVVSLKTQLSGQRLQNTDSEVRLFLQQLLDGVQALAAKLDADATVTDTNYAAVLATFVTD